MSALKGFYYNNQLKRFLVQFMAIFGDMQVQVGWTTDKEPRMVTVPIYGSSKDRVVAALKSENTQNKPIRLPTMSAWMSSIALAPEMRKGIPVNRRSTVMPSGGLFPDDAVVVQQRMPVPYKVTFELSIWASNLDQHHQIFEQILMLFNPQLQIQISDQPYDWTKITQVELTGIVMDENHPAGTDRRLTRSTLTFDVPVWVSVPSDVHKRYIKDIYIRLGTVTSQPDSSYDLIADFDAQGLPYELSFSVNDVDIGDEVL